MEKYSITLERHTQKSDELIGGYEVVKSYNAENSFMPIYKETNESFFKSYLHAHSFVAIVENTTIFSGYLVMFGVLVMGMLLALYGHTSVGEIFAMYFISAGVTSQIGELIQEIPNLMAGKAFYHKYDYANIDEDHETNNTITNGITLSHYSLAFDCQEKPVLHDINISFCVGRKYLIVGPSGSGKTSIIKSILGYYENFEGNMLFDGMPYNKATIAGVFKTITLVPQQSFFFHGSIRENLTFFDDAISDDMVANALRTANLHEKISEIGGGSVERGLDVELNEGVRNFSEGEKQCLAIARASLRTTKFMIFDEATSAIDTMTSIRIEKSFLTDPKHTVIFIAHRLHEETLHLYDEIIHIDSGEIKEKGCFKTLIDLKGGFYNMYNANKPNRRGDLTLD